MKTDHLMEKQVIEFLQQRQQLLKEELKSIETTIKAIAQSRPISGDSLLADMFVGSQEDEERETEPIEKKGINNPLLPQPQFNINSKLDQKISYALTKIGSGFKEDILEVINSAQPEMDPYKVEKAVAVRLSYLLKNEFIQATKHGRSYKYSLR